MSIQTENETLKQLSERLDMLDGVLKGENAEVSSAVSNYVYSQINDVTRLAVINQMEYSLLLYRSTYGLMQLAYQVHFTRNLERRDTIVRSALNVLHLLYTIPLNGHGSDLKMQELESSRPVTIQR